MRSFMLQAKRKLVALNHVTQSSIREFSSSVTDILTKALQWWCPEVSNCYYLVLSQKSTNIAMVDVTSQTQIQCYGCSLTSQTLFNNYGQDRNVKTAISALAIASPELGILARSYQRLRHRCHYPHQKKNKQNKNTNSFQLLALSGWAEMVPKPAVLMRISMATFSQKDRAVTKHGPLFLYNQ